MVPKSDGTSRLVIDYRKLNAVSSPSCYPLTRSEDVLENLEGMDLFTTLDLRSGYFSVPMHLESQPKTAFVTHCGQYEFKVLSFGLNDAVQSFQRMMDLVLAGGKYLYCQTYLDDVLIFSKGFNEHMNRLKFVFDRLRSANLKLNPKKCFIAHESLKFLGHIVSAKGISIDYEKVKCMVEVRRPTTVKEIRSFLGLIGFYRRFIKDFSIIAKPLTSLTRKDVPYEWTDECENAFIELKTRLTKAPILKHYDQTKETRVHCDASLQGIAAVLIQVHDGNPHPVMFLSRQLSNCESNYSTTELEALACVYAIKKMRHFLLGITFTFITDHSSLVWILNFKNPSGRVARWGLLLAEFSFKIIHRPGRLHSDVDHLSRAPVLPSEETDIFDEVPCMNIENINIHESQINDRYCQKIKNALHTNSKMKFKIENGILFKDTINGKLLVVPHELRREVLYACHNSMTAGHLGTAKTYDRVRRRYLWPRLYQSVKAYVQSCLDCAQRKRLPHPLKGNLQPIPVGDLFDKVGVDFLGPLPLTELGNNNIIVGVDLTSKYCEARAVKGQTAEIAAKFIVEDICLRHSFPKAILSDQGKGFLSEVTQELLKALEVRSIRTTGYHPQTNGQAEKINGIIVDMISHYLSDHQKDWDQILPYVIFAYNTAVQSSTGYSPFYLIYGREPILPIERVFGITTDNRNINRIPEFINEAREIAKSRITAAQQTQAERYNETSNPHKFNEGQTVMVYTKMRRVGKCAKFINRWFGPYVIEKRLSDVLYKVKEMGPKRRPKAFVVNLSRLKPYYGDVFDKEIDKEFDQSLEIIDEEFELDDDDTFDVDKDLFNASSSPESSDLPQNDQIHNISDDSDSDMSFDETEAQVAPKSIFDDSRLSPTDRPNVYVTRSGRISKPAKRLGFK